MGSAGGKSTARLVLLAQLHDEHGTARIKAHVHTVDDNHRDAADRGQPRGVTWSYGGFDLGAEYDGFAVTCYVGPVYLPGSPDDERGAWGLGYEYSPYRIESTRQAQAIARVMGKVERGMAKLTDTDGYVRDGDYAAYLARIAKILGIRELWVRNGRRRIDMSGERYGRVTVPSLAHWVSDVEEAVKKRTYQQDFIRS